MLNKSHRRYFNKSRKNRLAIEAQNEEEKIKDWFGKPIKKFKVCG
jgi:hypothetical protein